MSILVLNRSHIIAMAFAGAAIVTGMLLLWYPVIGITADQSAPASPVTPTAPVIPAPPTVEVLEQAGLGNVTVRVPPDDPKGIVLLLTGSEGQDAPLNALADSIVALNYVVASIDINAPIFKKMGSTSGVHDVTARLVELGETLADRSDIDDKLPLIAGLGSGGRFVYQVLAQADGDTFHAGLSLDFCPGADKDKLEPAAHLTTTWFVFQQAPACDAQDAVRFVQAVGNARMDNSIPSEATPASAQKPWASALSILQWLDPAIDDQLQADEQVPGVPLIETPAEKYRPGGRMVVMLSGDGGWAELDRTVASQLSDLGYMVVGWDSLNYFWNVKTPEQAAKDLERVLRYYQQSWKPGKISLVGYSFGANVLPFMASRLPADLRAQIDHIVLLTPETEASFEFHLSNWVTNETPNAVPLLPELAKLRWTKVLCLSGNDEDIQACPTFAGEGVDVAMLPGDHHFDQDYSTLSKRIVKDW